MSALVIEVRKLRRSRILVLAVSLSLAVILMTSMNLGSGKTLENFQDDPTSAWAGHIVGYVMASALLSPLQLALIASRIADIEHLGGGWRLNAIAGVWPGTLLRFKFAVLAGIVAILKTVEFAGVVTIPRLMGAPGDPDLGIGITTALGLLGTSLALAAVLLWIAAVVDSQLVVLGIGVIGGFLGLAAMLSPVWLALINPFGYYAALTPYIFTESSPTAITQQWFAWVVYLIVCAGLFVGATRTFNTKDQ